MKKRTLFGVLVIAFAFLGLNTYSLASTILPKFTYNESWAEKLYRYADMGDIWYEQGESGKFAIKVTLPATGISVDLIDAETEFLVEIGDFAGYSFRLADAINYQPGDTSAKFVLQDEFDNDNDVLKVIKYLNASFKWSLTKLTITINGKTADYISPPLAYDYLVDPIDTGPLVVPINESRDALVTITIKGNPVSQPFSVALTGKSSVKPVIKAEEQFDLHKVNLKGIAIVETGQ